MTKRLRYLIGIALFLFILSIFMKGYSYNSNYECVGTLSYKETVLNKQQKVFEIAVPKTIHCFNLEKKQV